LHVMTQFRYVVSQVLKLTRNIWSCSSTGSISGFIWCVVSMTESPYYSPSERVWEL
jgi:hypothetical protein